MEGFSFLKLQCSLGTHRQSRRTGKSIIKSFNQTFTFFFSLHLLILPCKTDMLKVIESLCEHVARELIEQEKKGFCIANHKKRRERPSHLSRELSFCRNKEETDG